MYDCAYYIAHTDCADWYASGYTISGVYIINPDGGDPFEVIQSHMDIYLIAIR